MQWNCRGIRVNWEELNDLIGRLCPVCLCIQDTMVSIFTPVGPPGYHTFYSVYMIRDITVDLLSLFAVMFLSPTEG